MSHWESHELEAVLQDAEYLAFVGGETMERAVTRIPYVTSEGQLEKLLTQRGRNDIVHQFTRNADRVKITQGVIR